jgi:hypothetical protein
LSTPRSGRRIAGAAALLAAALTVGLAPARSDPQAPLFKGFRILHPGPQVRNGDTLDFYAFYDSTDYEVTADLSQLDWLAAGPVPGTSVGNLPLDPSSPEPTWPAYLFSGVVLSRANPRPDASGIPVPITARNPRTGASVTNPSLRLCLRNHPPACDNTTRIVGSDERYQMDGGRPYYSVRNGDSLRLETTWRFHPTPFITRADFSAVDDSFAADRVFYGLVEAPSDTQQTHEIYYELNPRAKGPGTVRVPIRIHGTDGGCGRDSVTLWVLMDNQPPPGLPVFDALPAQVLAPALEVQGVAPDGSHDVLLVLNHSQEIVLRVVPFQNTLRFLGSVTLQPGINHLVAYARDVVGNRSLPSAPHTVDFRGAPQFRRWAMLAPDSTSSETPGVVRLGRETAIRVRTYWTNVAPESCNVRADFHPVDSLAAGPTWGTRCEDLVETGDGGPETWYGWEIEHRLSPGNPRADGDAIVVPITAHDARTGIETTTSSLEFCLSVNPPRHRWTRVIDDDPNRFVTHDEGDTSNVYYLVRNGSTVYLQTSWESLNRPLTMRADFSRADRDFLDWYVERWLIDSLSTATVATYGIMYRLSTEACCDPGQSRYPLPVRITVSDTGCGLDSTSVLLEMDVDGPEGSPRLDPVGADAVADTVVVSGLAPAGSADALARVEHADADSTSSVALALDAGLRFRGAVPVLPGVNRLTVYGRDGVGNLSSPSAVREITRVTEEWTFRIPKPFRPGNRFVLESRRGWSHLSAAVFSLEGDRLRAWEEPGQPLSYHADLAWDGRTPTGEAARPGPYLLRIRVTEARGGVTEEVRAFVLQR